MFTVYFVFYKYCTHDLQQITNFVIVNHLWMTTTATTIEVGDIRFNLSFRLKISDLLTTMGIHAQQSQFVFLLCVAEFSTMFIFISRIVLQYQLSVVVLVQKELVVSYSKQMDTHYSYYRISIILTTQADDTALGYTAGKLN